MESRTRLAATVSEDVQRFLYPIRIEKIGKRRYKLLDSFEYRIGSADGQEFVRVMAGFETDFASIPRFLWWLWPPVGDDYDGAALIHDCIYKTGYVSCNDGSIRWVTRAEGDGIMNEAMEVAGTPTWKRRPIFSGVRVGGRRAWNKHRKAQGHDVETIR